MKNYILEQEIFTTEVLKDFLEDVCKKNFEFTDKFIEELFNEVKEELYESFKDQIENN